MVNLVDFNNKEYRYAIFEKYSTEYGKLTNQSNDYTH